MAIQLGDIAPDFAAETTSGTLRFHQWIGESWAILFSHPADFTPVCTTELGILAALQPEFERRKVKIISISIDPLYAHERWIRDINEIQGTQISFPMIADPQRTIANLYGMIHPNTLDTLTVRSVFIIDPEKKVKLILTYPASTGRNFYELLRVIDSLQLTSKFNVATPANWQNGDEVIISNSIRDEDVAERFPKGHRIVKSYLRYTPQPNR